MYWGWGGMGGSDWGLQFVFVFFVVGLFLFFGGRGEVTDQCCKVYRLHVIVTAVTAIVLFLLFLCFLPRQWSVGTGMHKTLFLFMIFTRVLCIFAFATKKVEFLCNQEKKFFFFPQHAFSLQTRHYVFQEDEEELDLYQQTVFVLFSPRSCAQFLFSVSCVSAWRVCVMVNHLPKVFY